MMTIPAERQRQLEPQVAWVCEQLQAGTSVELITSLLDQTAGVGPDDASWILMAGKQRYLGRSDSDPGKDNWTLWETIIGVGLSLWALYYANTYGWESLSPRQTGGTAVAVLVGPAMLLDAVRRWIRTRKRRRRQHLDTL
jgi:hypothetical protein